MEKSDSQIMTELRRANPVGFKRVVESCLNHYEKFIVYLRTSLRDEEPIKNYLEICGLCAEMKTIDEIIALEKSAYEKIRKALMFDGKEETA